jgi:hypothetical protein|tara:strand:+ start:106 stop:390 length:285 start_codon:yes stop_codon:yes gene_type:complete
MKITSKQVQDYFSWRTDEELRHCPDCISEACNEVIEQFNEDNVTAKDLLKLLFFNDPIPQLHTHSYGFHTATGRHIIETLKEKYYEYRTNITTA